jgi:hypothetical protein
MIFGFSGKMGAGKNYICENIFLPLLKKHNRNVIQMSFADQIKVNVMVNYNLSKNDVCNDKNYKIRNLLQKEGTQDGRNRLGDDIWINHLDKWMEIHKSKGVHTFLITDVRFKNEAEYIKRMGGKIIRVEAPERNKDLIIRQKLDPLTVNHISETDLDNYYSFDLILDNDYNISMLKNQEILNDFFMHRFVF